MAGLLDFASTPEGMQGLALLAAAGPSMQPMNLASRMALAGSTYRGLLDDQVKQQLGKAQLENLTQQTQLGNLQLQQAKQQWELQQPLLQQLVTRMSGAQGAAPAVASQPAIAPSQGGAMGSGTFGMSVGGQPASTMGAGPAPAGGTSMIPGVPDDVARWTVATGGLKGIPALMTEYNKPTDFQKMLTAAGIDPSSPLGRQMIQGNLAKQNYIAPVNARPGSILRDPNDPSRVVAFNPHVPDGTMPVFDSNGNVTQFQPIGNAEAALALGERAKTFGKAQATPSVVYNNGVPSFSTVAQDVRRAEGAQLPAPQPGMVGNFRGDPAQVSAAIDNIKDPQERANARAAFESQMRAQGGQLTPQQIPGAVVGQENAQNELGKRWTALQSANSEAQNTASYLESIKELAGRAAVGPFTDKLQLTNALLGLVGNEKAKDATTANALLDKYSNQIVARLGGSGGLATDSARSILQSAYPNAHMTPEAIQEAADNLKGAQLMTQAKARLLAPYATARDPVAYTQKELTFDQNADPRLYQLAQMPPEQAKKWLSAQPASVQADLRRRAANLKMIGAL